MGARQRVVITGIGAITPIGSGVDGLWSGVLRGSSAVRRVTRFDASPFRSRLAAEIDDFDPHAYLEPRRVRRLDRFSQLAVAASLPALGGVAFAEEQHQAYLREGIAEVSPSLALSVFGGAAASNVAIDAGLRGPG